MKQKTAKIQKASAQVDYGSIFKTFSHTDLTEQRRYSPSGVLHVKRTLDLISTSHVEKQNHTLRMHCRRLTRQTNAFSKKLENFEAAVILSFAYHKIYKMHAAIQTARRWPLARKIASGALRSLSNRWRMENTSKSRRTWFLTFTPANQHGLKPRQRIPRQRRSKRELWRK